MLKIYLSKNISLGGATATIANANGDEIDVAGGRSTSVRRACLSAAKQLREAAARFEQLAEVERPFHAETHKRINARRTEGGAA